MKSYYWKLVNESVDFFEGTKAKEENIKNCLFLCCLSFLINFVFNIKGGIPSFGIWGDFPLFRL